jgi:1,4-alpha-glucan branching enzyme
MPGDRWQQLATMRAYLAYMWAHPGKQLLFMGSEFAQSAEWSEARSLDWWLLDYPEHRGIQTCVRDLNRLYQDHAALWSQDHVPAGFEWIDANDAQGNVYSWVRRGSDGSAVAVVVNFSPLVRSDYRIGLPGTGTWTEIMNTDAEAYGGSGVGNLGSVVAVAEGSHGLPASAIITVPPLASVWLRWDDAPVSEEALAEAEAIVEAEAEAIEDAGADLEEAEA